jgi:hypothetical protein
MVAKLFVIGGRKDMVIWSLYALEKMESYGFTLHRLVLPASAIGPKKEDTWRGQSTNDMRTGTHGFGTK